MRVYRLEDKQGRGCFSSKKRMPKYDDTKPEPMHSRFGCTVKEMSWIYCEKNNISRDEYRFGCDSLDKLENYWSDLKRFEDIGWIVAEYEVDEEYIFFGEDAHERKWNGDVRSEINIGSIELAFKADKAVRV